MSKVDRGVVGLIFGNALTNVTSLFANGVFEFEDPNDAQASVDELVEVAKLLTLASVDAQVEVGDEVGADENPTKRPSGTSGRRGSSGGRSTSRPKSDRPAGVKRENRDKPATEKQLNALEKMGYEGPWDDLTMSEASDAIQSLAD